MERPVVFAFNRRQPLADTTLATLWSSLAPDERARWGTYLREADRARFLLARGMLRRSLAWLRGEAPAAVAIELGAHGKPRCAGGPEFNLSHSGDIILLALHPSSPVGVDVERERSVRDWESIARRLFTGTELEALLRQPRHQQERAFLRQWSRFEAEIKARGCGLAGQACPAGNEHIRRWDVTLPGGYVGAAALLRPAEGEEAVRGAATPLAANVPGAPTAVARACRCATC